MKTELINENSGKWIAVGICLMALILRAWGYEYGLPIVYNGDEGQLVNRAVRFGSGDLNPHNFIYPSLYKYVLFACYGAYFVVGKVFGIFYSLADFKDSYFLDPSPFYVIGRLISAIAGSLTLFYIYLIGKRFHSVAVGLIAALFFCFEYEHFRFSHFAKPDALMTMLTVMSTYYAFRIFDEGKRADYLLAGILGGLAVSTKYNAAFVAIAICAAHLLRHWSVRGEKDPEDWRWSYLIMSGAVFIGFFLLGTPYSLLDFKTFLQDIRFQEVVVTQKHSLVTFMTTVFTYIKTLFLPEELSLHEKFFGIFIVLGFLKSFYKPSKKDLIVLSFLVTHFIFFAYKTSSSFLKLHYLLPVLALFYLLGARFFVEAMQALAPKLRRYHTVMIVTLLFLMIAPTRHVLLADYMRVKPDTGNLARAWIEENIPASTRILIASAHNLALKESEESLLNNSSQESRKFLKDKVSALKKYSGRSYNVSYLYHGWGFVEKNKIEKIASVPQGIQLVNEDKLAIDYWKQSDIEYVIVFSKLDSRGNPEEMKHERFRRFYEELWEEAKLVKEFLPNYPSRPGFPVRIYQLKSP
ncbi:glycosyltransferase family 39 protein [bacterium]|nr:glycosyltransferase family 39 protein [bacterium]